MYDKKNLGVNKFLSKNYYKWSNNILELILDLHTLVIVS